MTKEEIIEIIEKSGLLISTNVALPIISLHHAEKFAKLVAEKTLETKDEPVAWGMETDGLIYDVICPDEHEREEGEYTIPLYTTPQRTWVGLTDEDEIDWEEGGTLKDLVKAIETKIKDKNK
jgi:hypothetical protein